VGSLFEPRNATSDLLALPYHSPGGQSLKHSSAVQTNQI